MKKVLSILSALTLSATAATSVIACTQSQAFDVTDLSSWGSQQKTEIGNFITNSLVGTVRSNTVQNPLTVNSAYDIIKSQMKINLNQLLGAKTPVGVNGISDYIETTISASDLQKPLSANQTFTVNVRAVNNSKIFNPIKGAMSLAITLSNKINLAALPAFIFIGKPASPKPKTTFTAAELTTSLEAQIKSWLNIPIAISATGLKIQFANTQYLLKNLYQKGSLTLTASSDDVTSYFTNTWEPAFVVGKLLPPSTASWNISFSTGGTNPTQFPKKQLSALLLQFNTKISSFLTTKLEIPSGQKLKFMKDYSFDFDRILNYFTKTDAAVSTVDLSKVKSITVFILKNSKLIWSYNPVFNINITWTR